LGFIHTRSTALRVLVADDHELTRFSLKLAFAQCSHLDLVAIARDGREAVRLFQECDPDVTIVDINMPVLDGLGVAAEIKKLQPHARILAYTSEEQVSEREGAAFLDAVCGKEAPTETLLATVEQLGSMVRAC